MDKENILNALKNVKYPGYSRDIVSFGLVKGIKAENGKAEITLSLTTNNAEIINQLRKDCESAILNIPGIKEVVVEISHPNQQHSQQNPWAGQTRIKDVKYVIAVASGKGGVGKSTCSVNIACALKHLGLEVGLLDCDIYGPTIPLMMGVKQQPFIENDKLQPIISHGVKLMSIGFLIEDDAPVIWRGPLIMKVIQQFLHEVDWGRLDYLIVDLPPGTGDAQLSLCQNVPLDGGIIVTTPQEASLGVVRKGIAMFEKVNVKILGIIENMSYFITPTGERVEIFGNGGGRSEANRRGIPFLGEVPIFTEIRISGDKGVPVVVSDPDKPPAQAFINIAREIHKHLA
ncbi:MAG TPA: Mrp/NBP35 family ATP-binding protein [Verrucomicrobiota bacterium]|nr:Mrp/NBP35 family ATP-binding protein [Verrucomicrobiota bacterium]